MTLFNKLSELVKTRRIPGVSPNAEWPFIRGSYHVVDSTAAVAVITLGDEKLAKDLATLATKGLCVTFPLAGGRGDIERLVHILTSNLSIQHLLCVGDETLNPGMLTALNTLFRDEEDFEGALHAMGRSKMRLAVADVAALRKQVQFTDMHGCTEIDKIVAKIRDLSTTAKRSTTGFVAPNGKSGDNEKRVIASDTLPHEQVDDKAGHFKIAVGQGRIIVEHYNNKDERQRIIEGKTARSICLTLIRNGWVSRLDHAAYLGRELTRAEIALQNGEAFHQAATTSE